MLAGRVWNIAYVSRHIECAGGNKVSASPLFNGARGVFVDLARDQQIAGILSACGGKLK